MSVVKHLLRSILVLTLLVAAGMSWFSARAQSSSYGSEPSGSQLLGAGNPQTSSSSTQDNGGGAGTMPMGVSPLPSGSTSRSIVLPGNNGVTPNGSADQTGRPPEVRTRPQPLTDFQRLVATSTGKIFPIYGEDLFRGVPSTFAPIDQVPVTPDYVVGPGDELRVQAWGQVNLDGHYTVDRTGNIYLPQVGTVSVAGLPFAKVTDYIRSQMSRVFRNFDLNVNMGQLRSIQIFVVGEAVRPGSYTISSLSTLVNALFATGGPAPTGSMRDIQLKRSGKVIEDFDLYDLLQRGDKSRDVALLPGDVIYIPHAGRTVAVLGSVNLPAIYELRSKSAESEGESTVESAIRLAGGLTSTASDEHLRIERISGHSDLSIMDVDLTDEGKKTELRDGDIVEFSSILDRFKDAVTLRGNVTNPGRYVWRPGMRVRDLIPSKESLVSRRYWEQHNLLGQYAPQYIPLSQGRLVGMGGTSESRSSSIGMQQPSDGRSANGAQAGGPQQPDGLQQGSDLQQSSDFQQAANAQQPIGLQQGTVVSGTDSASQSNNRATRSNLASASAAPSGVFAARNDVVLSAPDIDWSYAVIERQSKKDLSTSLIPFNLGGAILDGNAADNVELQAGDVITIFSKADIRVPQSQQTRFVRLEGEFVAAGVYSVLPGESLRQLVIRAGGLTPNAYLFGASFTRRSEQRLQQERLNEYVDELEAQVAQTSMSAANRAASPADAAAAASNASNGQTLVARLRMARAAGRIVLESKPDSQGADSLPDLPLEDGDRFVVPRVPSSVEVAGAVYNQNAFLYDPQRRVGDYLHLAGGTNRDADKARAFVIRADGSVISKQYSSALRGGSFDAARVYPGDTVVVPQKLDRRATIRNLLDFSQILSSFGLGIAAIQLL